jgi:hypothetical protein
MTNLVRRIEQLEQGSIGIGRVIVIEGPDGYDTERALAELGVTRTDNDLVVYLRKMFESAAPLRLVRISATPCGR